MHKLQFIESGWGLETLRLYSGSMYEVVATITVTVFCYDDNRTGSSHAYTFMQILNQNLCVHTSCIYKIMAMLALVLEHIVLGK